MPERLSRRDRRIVERYNRKDSAKSLRPQSAVLKSLDEVLDQENDLRFLENELVSHRASLRFDKTLLFYLKSLSDLGVTESSLRVIFRDPLDNKKTFNILMNEALRFPLIQYLNDYLVLYPEQKGFLRTKITEKF